MGEKIRFSVNSTAHSIEKSDQRKLLDFLREDQHLMGSKNGCGKGQCGACSVLINNELKRACVVKLNRLDKAKIETIENLENDPIMQNIQEAFLEEGAVQCGFCTPGMIIATKALLIKNPDPKEGDIKKVFKQNLCRCTGYVAIIKAVQNAAKKCKKGRTFKPQSTSNGSLIGKSLIREDAIAKCTGKAVYADDLFETDMLVGKIKFSDHPHAEIIRIDTSVAEQTEGVEIILTGEDVPGRNSFGITVPQQPVLADKKVQYHGDLIAAVFANSSEAAQKAVDAIEVEYKILPTLNSPDEAKKSPYRLNDCEGNLAEELHLTKGDIGKGFEIADVIVEGEYEVPFVEHAYLEPESCFSKMMDGVLTVWTPSQDSVHMLECLMAALDLSEKQIRVIQSVTGGAFGGKQEPTIQVPVALATLLTGKPAKITLTREESIRVSTKRHAAIIKMKHGATKAGKLIAFESSTILDAGAYLSETRWVNFRTCVAAAGPYEIPNVKTSAHSYYTNNNPAGAFRGFGSTQVCFASEIQMNKLATKLGINPYEIRRCNAIENGGETITGQILTSGVGYAETLDSVNKQLEKVKDTITCRPGCKLGIGIASSYKNVGIGLGTEDSAEATVELNPNGTFEIRTGSAEMGQGTSTLISQIAAHELGVPYEDILTTNCDTHRCPEGGVTTASRQTFVTGNAVRLAAEKMKQHLELNTSLSGAWNQNNLRIAYETLFHKNLTTRADYRYLPPVTAPFQKDGNHKHGQSLKDFDIHYAYCFTTCAVILEVDETSGETRVNHIILAQDTGKAINPKMVIAQIEGAVVMGMGYGLSEDLAIENAIIKNNTLKKIHIPVISETPVIDAIIVEEPDANGPYGAKGMGEIPINPIAPAISNAIYNAVGVSIDKIPIKKSSLLEALNNRKLD